MTDILVVITRLAVGGAPQNVLAAVRGLDRSRYRVTLVTGTPEPDEGSLLGEARSAGVRLCRIPELVREVSPRRDARAFAALYRLIRQNRFDIVHTHLSKAGMLGRLAATCAGVPAVVHTYHGDVFQDYFGQGVSRVLLGLERLIGRATHRSLVVSDALGRRYREYRVARRATVRTVPNGVWANGFRMRTPGVGTGTRVGTVAMFYPIKRLDLFLSMARTVLEVRADAEFVVIGGGGGAAVLEASVRDLGDRVRFLGIRYDVPELLRTLDVFVQCSDYEGAGVGMMEAMLSGVPVVATAVGGVPEVVDDGETGFLVPRGDVAALSQRVSRLLGDADLRARMGSAAREVALTRFSAARMVERLDAVYTELVQEARAL